jgi:DNA-binding LacI/PurR family transcriptional regulator
MVAAIISDVGCTPVARVLAGVHRQLHRRGYLLVLGFFDGTSGSQNVSAELRQRGIEGVVALDVTLPPELELPIASVDLEYMTFLEPLAEDARTWLSDLGESAAETVLRQIEKKTTPRRMKIVPKLPRTYFALSNIDIGASAIAREGA